MLVSAGLKSMGDHRHADGSNNQIRIILHSEQQCPSPDPGRKEIEENLDLVAASRNIDQGRRIGGPKFKSTLSALAGLSLQYLRRIGTTDATNSYKLYKRSLLETVEIESTGGFELGIEITVKAFLQGARIGEIPTQWTDREAGVSKFKLLEWLPSYLKWYLHAFQPRKKQKN
jgi:dolichol-phosphate mannosyltransferase